MHSGRGPKRKNKKKKINNNNETEPHNKLFAHFLPAQFRAANKQKKKKTSAY